MDDPNYRYKMPRIIGKIEGRGNGIKTVLFNVIEVSQSLNRDPQEVTKFFGCEFGSQTTYATDTDRAIVNGAHQDKDLQTHIHKYIENFVLCKNCRLPETTYKIKDGAITQRCAACGSKTNVDMQHKLTAFILAQHKKNKELQKSGEKEASKKEKKKDRDAVAVREKDNGEGDKDKARASAAAASGSSSKKKSHSSKDDLTVFAFGEGAGGGDAAAASAEAEETDSKAAGEVCVCAKILLLLK